MSPLRQHTITLRTVLIYALALAGIALFFGYVLFQARFIIEGPQISLTSDTPAVSQSRVVTLAGQARNIARMTLNGRQIYTDKYGNFKEALVLENGYTITTLQAEDRYGRTTTLSRSFVHIDPGSSQLSINHQ